MAIPDFQSIMLPLLRTAGDGRIRSSGEYREALAEHFRLTGDELAEMLPSRRAPLFSNRVAWAIIYLQRAGLLTRTSRSHYRITDAGLAVLEHQPEKIDLKFLQQYPAYREWRSKSTDSGKPESTPETAPDATQSGFAHRKLTR